MPAKKPKQPTPPPKPAIVALKPRNEEPQPAQPDPETTEQKPEENAIFQAIGIIVGDVTFEEKAFIAIAGKQYPLFYAPSHKKAFEALKLNVKRNTATQRLLVYPRVIHLPGGKPHQTSFQVVGFEGTSGNVRENLGLEDFEFTLSGLWQFIPVSKTPCISVFKNFSEDRLAYVKEAPSELKVKYMKASHIPVLWKDAQVKPFRFNPKLEKEQQGQVWFVGIKARFLPGRDVFGFVSLKLPPAAKPPKYLKASKQDKAEGRRAQTTKPKERAS